MSDSLDAVVLPLIEELAEEGWCVVLKKLPKYLGWYFGEISGGRQLEGTWCCEASWADHDKGPWKHTRFACKPTALEAVNAVAEQCRPNAPPQQRDEGAYAEGACSPSVTSRWDGETLIWVIEGIEILDSDLRAWCMLHMPDEWQKPHDGIIRKYHTTAWWQAWKRGDHLKPNVPLTGSKQPEKGQA